MVLWLNVLNMLFTWEEEVLIDNAVWQSQDIEYMTSATKQKQMHVIWAVNKINEL